MIKGTSRASQLGQTLGVLAELFGAQGWQSTSKPQRSLRMFQDPEASVAHTLLISEVLSPADLPRDDVMGLSCQVNIYFAELEKLINGVLSYDESIKGKLSVILPLSQLAPKEHLYAGNVYLIPLNSGDIVVECSTLLEDFAQWLEPTRKRLESQMVFDDARYSPPYVLPLSWELRRLAHIYLHGSSEALRSQIKLLEPRVNQILEEGQPSASPFDRLKTRGLRQTAEETSKFVEFCKNHQARNPDAATSKH